MAVEDDSLYLARHSNRTAQVLPLLPAGLRAETSRLVAAERDLLGLSGGRTLKLKEGVPAPRGRCSSFPRPGGSTATAGTSRTRTNGAPPRYGPALRAYNNSSLYVDAVTRYAREIAANPYGLYHLYCWLP